MKMEFSSQRREKLLFLTTNMVVITSRINQFITNCYKINIRNIMIKRCVTLKMNCANLIIGLENVLTLSSSNQ